MDEARPENASRAVLHLSGALVALTLVAVLTPRALVVAAACFFVGVWTLELWRRRAPRVNERLNAFFERFTHPRERVHVTSTTWYVTALVPLAASGVPEAQAVGLAVLGVGDPAASFVGRRLGRVRLGSRRTLEGTLAFVVCGGLAAMASLAWIAPQLGPSRALPLALAGAVGGAVAELVSLRVDDNLTIPLAAGLASAAWLSLG